MRHERWFRHGCATRQCAGDRAGRRRRAAEEAQAVGRRSPETEASARFSDTSSSNASPISVSWCVLQQQLREGETQAGGA